MTTISRTFRKKGRPEESRLVRAGSNQDNSLALFAGALIFARKIKVIKADQTKSNHFENILS